MEILLLRRLVLGRIASILRLLLRSLDILLLLMTRVSGVLWLKRYSAETCLLRREAVWLLLLEALLGKGALAILRRPRTSTVPAQVGIRTRIHGAKMEIREENSCKGKGACTASG